MTGRLALLVAIAGCYAPHAAPGSPCNPTTANCPEGQSCVSVGGGSYVCTAGVAGDAAADTPISDAPRDARMGIDAPVDSAFAPWTLIQTGQAENAGSVTLGSPTATGHVIIVGVETTSQVIGVDDDGANLYTQVPGATASAASASLGISLWYAKSNIAAKTIMVAAPSVSAIVVWEVAGLRPTSPLDTAAALSDQAATTLPAAPVITTAQPGELVISIAIVQNSVTGLHAGSEFTNDRLAKGNGWAHLTSSSAPAGPHQATWDQPMSGVYCATSAAFFTGP